MAEDGAYTRLLDWYYTNESPIPAGEAYKVARASTPADRKAVAAVLVAHFELVDGHYHNARADKELGIAVPKINKLREVARENGRKSKGRPRKNQNGLSEETESGSSEKPRPIPNPVSTRDVGQPPSANPQPPEEPLSDHRFHGDGDSSATERKAAPASTPTPTPDAPARILAECTRAGINAPEGDGIVQRWIRNGYTATQVARATAEAPFGKGAPKPMTSAYVDPIVERIVEQDRKARASAEAKVTATQEQIAQQRKRADEAVPMPENMRPRKAAAA